MRPRALSLDLFGTIVFFDVERLPRRLIAGSEKIVTIAGIDDLLRDVAPAVTLEGFLAALAQASTEIARQKMIDRREVPTHERFRRALVSSGAGASDIDAAAATMAERHMAALADAVVCPPDRRGLLEKLASTHPLALVSNFDHGPTAHRLLARFGLTTYFRTIVVSADVGIMKPATEIFDVACARLATDPGECLHVGDSREADVQGAAAAGMTALWIGEGDDAAPAVECISDLRELPAWLAARYA